SSYTVRSPSLTRTSALCWRPFTGITNSKFMSGPHREPDGGVLVTTPATCGPADRHRQPATVGVRAVGVGAGENLFQLSLAQRGCVAGVPRLEPGQGRVVAEAQVAGQPAGEAVGDAVPVLASALVGQLRQVTLNAGDQAGRRRAVADVTGRAVVAGGGN